MNCRGNSSSRSSRPQRRSNDTSRWQRTRSARVRAGEVKQWLVALRSAQGVLEAVLRPEEGACRDTGEHLGHPTFLKKTNHEIMSVNAALDVSKQNHADACKQERQMAEVVLHEIENLRHNRAGGRVYVEELRQQLTKFVPQTNLHD